MAKIEESDQPLANGLIKEEFASEPKIKAEQEDMREIQKESSDAKVIVEVKRKKPRLPAKVKSRPKKGTIDDDKTEKNEKNFSGRKLLRRSARNLDPS